MVVKLLLNCCLIVRKTPNYPNMEFEEVIINYSGKASMITFYHFTMFIIDNYTIALILSLTFYLDD